MTDTTTTLDTAETMVLQAPLTEETRVAVLNAEATDPIGHCLVCYTDLHYRAVTACAHNEICGTCHLRIRHLHNDRNCPICKTEQETVVVDATAQAKGQLSDYPIWGQDLGADFVFREDVGMFFRKDYYETAIQPLFGYHCTKCDFDGASLEQPKPDSTQQQQQGKGNKPPPTPIRTLQDHLRTAHRLALCQLCVDHQRDFVARLPRFTPAQLQRHLKQGDGKQSGFQGHPVCEFCRPKRFYDLTQLHSHLAKEHYKCHVCEQQHGLANQYFKNYNSLEKHFDRQHFLCHDVQCLTARFVVFGSELDLRHHERQVHGGTSTGDTKLQLEFRVRRSGESSSMQNQEAPSEQDFNYGLDGAAFVPADLPRNEGNAANLHPLHVQRTAELRQQAAALRDDSTNEEEAFPSLAQANGSAEPAMRVGWTGNGALKRVGRQKDAGQVTDQDFPSLPTGAPKKGNRKSTGALASTQRQFAAMSASANRPASGWNSGGSQAATATVGIQNAANLSSNNFPSLGGRPAQTVPTYPSNQKANLSADNFPSLGAPSLRKHNYAAANALARKNQPKAAPSWDSTTDFPAPPKASTSSNRSRLLAPKASNAAAAMNTLHAPSAMSANVTLDDIKVSMGSNRYKKLKGFTKDFATGNLQPDAYVDHAATLFDRGYGDVDFWRFLPTLIASCPNPSLSDQAMRYLENLKRMRNGAVNAEAHQQQQTAPAPDSTWSAGPRITTASQRTSSGMRYVAPAPARIAAKKGGPKVWGGGQASVVRAKAPPGSVAVAASKAGPQTGSATKFMAKQQKQDKQQPKNPKKKNKKKQNDELRALAFGS